MPPRPFPFPFGIGTDIVRIRRVRELIAKERVGHGREKTNLVPFLRRVFTPREQSAFWKLFHTEERALGDQSRRVGEWISGRWAAKEAIIKAVRFRPLTLKEIEIHQYPPVSCAHAERKGVFALILDQRADTKEARSTQSVGQGQPSSEPSSADDLLESYSSSLSEEIHGMENANIDPARQAPTPYEELEGQIAKISISHDGEYATAVAIAYDEPPQEHFGSKSGARSHEVES